MTRINTVEHERAGYARRQSGRPTCQRESVRSSVGASEQVSECVRSFTLHAAADGGSHVKLSDI